MAMPGYWDGDTAGAISGAKQDFLGMDPVIASAAIKAGGQVLGAALTPQPNNTTQTLRNAFDSPFDSSGWTVSIGSGSASAADSRTQSKSASEQASSGGINYLPYVFGLLGVVVVWRLIGE